MRWPTAALDPVRQLHVLAETLPGVGLVERIVDAPFDELWAGIEDMEHTVPSFDPLVASLRIVERNGDRLRVVTRFPVVPFRTRFEVELRRGWCLMQSSVYVVGMAARPEGDRTRYAQLEGFPWRRTPRIVRPVLRAIVTRDVNGMERIATSDPLGRYAGDD